MIIVIWIVFVVYVILFMMVNDIFKYNDINYCFCIFILFDNQKLIQIYYLVIFILFYCVFLIILLVLYSFIIYRFWQWKILGNVSEVRIRLVQGEKRRIVKVLILIVMVFVVCWFLVYVMYYLVYYCKDIYCSILWEVEMFFFWFCYVNSIINLCLYVLISFSYCKFLQGSFGCFCFCCSYVNFNLLIRCSIGMFIFS